MKKQNKVKKPAQAFRKVKIGDEIYCFKYGIRVFKVLDISLSEKYSEPLAYLCESDGEIVTISKEEIIHFADEIDHKILSEYLDKKLNMATKKTVIALAHIKKVYWLLFGMSVCLTVLSLINLL